MQNKQPRAHHDIIVAWANGAEIQYRPHANAPWVDSPDPAFVEDYEYRVKPERRYPLWLVADHKIASIYDQGHNHNNGLHRVVSAAIREMIDGGVLVTREEFDRAIGDRAKRDYAVADKVAEEIAKLLPMSAALLLYNISLKDMIAKVKA